MICDDVVKEVETTIDKVSMKHNVKTDVMYNYIEKETGARIMAWVTMYQVQTIYGSMTMLLRLANTYSDSAAWC